MGIDREALKKLILELIEEDREFRHAIMAVAGYKEILDRITRLEERFAKLEERFAALEERQLELEKRFAKLEERFARLEEEFKRLEERQQKLEERFAQLEERFLKLEERVARLEERVTRLEERMLKVEESLENLSRLVITVAHRFGVASEEAFREAMKGILEEYFGATAHRWTVFDSEGLVYGRPSTVEVDVVVKDNVHILVEVKSRVDTGDILELSRIAKLYEKREGVKPELAIVGAFITPRARELAEKLGVKIYTYTEK
jgi:hypothetical protein